MSRGGPSGGRRSGCRLRRLLGCLLRWIYRRSGLLLRVGWMLSLIELCSQGICRTVDYVSGNNHSEETFE